MAKHGNGRLMYALRNALTRFHGRLLDLVFPRGAQCAVCGAVSRGEYLCPRCLASLQQDSFARSWDWRDLELGIRAYSLRPHEGTARALVLRLKYRAEADAARLLTSLVLPLPSFVCFSPGTVVTWVPMPEGRRRERCIDHSRLLAELVAEQLGLPCLQLLRREGSGPRQATLNRSGRQQNLKHAFSPLRPVGTPVLLVDDVLTTGTTALRCAQALRQAGAEEITVLTMTHSGR